MAFEAGRLWFWRPKPRKRSDPVALCTALEAGREPAELEDVRVAEILKALKEHYPSLELSRKRRLGEVDLEDEEMAFELDWSQQHFHFTFYGYAGKHMDRVVDLMTKQGLPCYDASGGKMYTVKKPPRFT